MRDLQFWLCAAALVAAAGCGDEIPPGPTGTQDQKEIKSVIGEMNDTGRPQSWFAAGAAPDAKTLQRYGGYYYVVTEEPQVEGGKATALVTAEDNVTHEARGPLTWEFVKEQGGWRIKSAPLE